MSDARPFLKWAGGKKQLADRLLELLPKQIHTYYEPFVGAGAMFFALAAAGRFDRAVLNDSNKELMDTFRVMRDFPEDLIEQLSQYPYSREVFDAFRAKMPSDYGPVRRAARMIYLNRTCFNGLFRVNKAGRFNVPWGKYKNPKIVDPQNFHACARVLNRYAALFCEDFAGVVDGAGPHDAVYFDPPYIPLSSTSNFSSYTVDGFTLDDQYRLAILFKQLADAGVAVVASNSDTEMTRKLYEGFEMHQVYAKRAINSKGNRRGPVPELIIVSRKGKLILAEEPVPDTKRSG
jgi:DNA adenine methylase